MGDKPQPFVRTGILEKVREKFENMIFWTKMEGTIALICSEMPNPTTILNKKKFLEQMSVLKSYLIEKGVEEKSLKFLDKEMALHEETKIVSLYHERNDELSQDLIDAYSRIAPGTEGIISIDSGLNYSQLARLTDGVYQKTKLIKFFISNEKVIRGKVIAEIYAHPQSILMATLVQSKKKDKETGEPNYKKVIIFGERISKLEQIILKEIHLSQYVYRFISEDNKDYVIFTQEQVKIGDYILTGVETECSDFRALTESAKLPTKLPYFFVQKMQNRIVQYKSKEEFSEKLKSLDIKPEVFMEYPFCAEMEGGPRKLLHPTWYKWLIWAWVTHQPKGSFNRYPLHIIQCAPPNSGKSLQLNALHSRSNEASSIFSGSSSTLKSLIPSFRHNPAKLGYLAESNRFSYCDEFLRCIMNNYTDNDKAGSRDEGVGKMNDLLEHQKRQAGSGNSSVNVNMTSRIFATTNPLKGTSNIESMLKSLDHSFLTRWLIYYQTESHHKLVLDSDDSLLKPIEYKISNHDWVSIIDYLHNFSAKYDMVRVMGIYNKYIGIFSESVNAHYISRHKHHIECLIDGIIKSRCLINNDMSFEGIDEDYENLEQVWSSILEAWMTQDMIKNMDTTKKIFFMPEDCQFLYKKIYDCGQPLEYQVIVDMVKDDLNGQKFLDAYYLLKSSNLILQLFGKIQTYDYAKAKYEEDEKVAGQREL